MQTPPKCSFPELFEKCSIVAAQVQDTVAVVYKRSTGKNNLNPNLKSFHFDLVYFRKNTQI